MFYGDYKVTATDVAIMAVIMFVVIVAQLFGSSVTPGV